MSRRLDPAAALFGSMLVFTGVCGAFVAGGALQGCAAFAASPIPADTQALETCVANQLLANDLDPVTIAAACSVTATAELADLVVFLVQQLEASGKVPAGTSAKVRALAEKIR